jgi:hypothetical protein
MTAYATATRVETLVGDVITDRKFTATTIPSVTEVNQFLTATGAEIDAALDFAGYTTPVSITTDAIAYEFVTQLNAIGGAMYVLAQMPAQSYTEPGEESPSQGRRQFLQQQWQRGIKRIEDKRLKASGLSDNRNLVKSGSSKDSDGVLKYPTFKRDLFDFPGSHTRQGADRTDTY